jgi:hypothetical protein
MALYKYRSKPRCLEKWQPASAFSLHIKVSPEAHLKIKSTIDLAGKVLRVPVAVNCKITTALI